MLAVDPPPSEHNIQELNRITRNINPAQQVPSDPGIHACGFWLAVHLEDRDVCWKSQSQNGINFFREMVAYYSLHPDHTIQQFLDGQRAAIEKALGKACRSTDLVDSTVRCFCYWYMIERLWDKWKEGLVKQDFATQKQLQVDDILEGRFNVAEFMKFTELVPEPGPQTSRQDISRDVLNAAQLVDIAKARLEWTKDISQHFVLEEDMSGPTLYLFDMPSRLLRPGERGIAQKTFYQQVVSEEFVREIRCSYFLLFTANRKSKRLYKRNRDNAKHLRIPFDPQLDRYCQNEPDGGCPTNWSNKDFKHLWPRIEILKECAERTPRGLWAIIWYDRHNRRSATWWGFFIGIIILLLTFAQTGLSAIQVYKAYQPTST